MTYVWGGDGGAVVFLTVVVLPLSSAPVGEVLQVGKVATTYGHNSELVGKAMKTIQHNPTR